MRHANRWAIVLSCMLPTWVGSQTAAQSNPACTKVAYLTFDTGHMEVAPLIADILKRHDIRVTFFLANEKTKTGGGSLDEQWQGWWQQRSLEGHAFGSHTYDHVYWLADLPNNQFKVRASAGPDKGKIRTMSASDYCAELSRSATRYTEMTGRSMLPIFRAAGGKTSPALIKAAGQCGYQHVGWSASGFLGDELPSDKYPNKRLLEQSLRQIKNGDILVAHLGIWSRQDPWAPTVLEPLIIGLKEKGFCFKTIAEHPTYADHLSAKPGSQR